MNSREKKVLQSWRLVLWEFVKREWFSLFLATSLGIVAAESFDLLLRDQSFRGYLVSNFKPSVSFDDPEHYVPYLVIVFGTMFLAVVALVFGYVRRGLRSWWAGVTSGLVLHLLPLLSFLRFSHPGSFTIDSFWGLRQPAPGSWLALSCIWRLRYAPSALFERKNLQFPQASSHSRDLN